MSKVLMLQRDFLVFGFLLLLCAVVALPTLAAEAGRVKVSKGDVQIERDGKRLPAPVGARIRARDTVKTGPDGSVGITFQDNSLLSAGPNSELVIECFVFDSTTHKGEFDTALKKGTLAVVSGKIVKQSPEAMRVKTPAAIMGVRGTEFVVKVDESATK
ncbi:MAG TPA: FecR domain-containing protein [Burkholderiales bacterium]|jgi:hypothetical protein|nr:FecR domain-containing protein [Burkholderiales bacterium]